ncbi:hypothetical protein CPB86DRAFT_504593 [Serendipita vermifera]|nr:hypothetical protein CPB86DRAFT_504593 [Serendipita vermifera]
MREPRLAGCSLFLTSSFILTRPHTTNLHLNSRCSQLWTLFKIRPRPLQAFSLPFQFSPTSTHGRVGGKANEK